MYLEYNKGLDTFLRGIRGIGSHGSQKLDILWNMAVTAIVLIVIFYVIALLFKNINKLFRMSKTQNDSKDTTWVGEFIKALSDGRTYDPFHNAYALFGFLWGIPIPLMYVFYTMVESNFGITISSLMLKLAVSPVFYIFLVHPFIFAVFFGAFGTLRLNQIYRNKKFMREQVEKIKTLEEDSERIKKLMKKELDNIHHSTGLP